MHLAKSYQHRLATSMAAVFALQIFAIAFCFSAQAQAAPMAETHAMAAACPMGMESPIKQQAPACSHCDLPDTSTFASSISNLSVDLPLIAVLVGYWHVHAIIPATYNFRLAQAQAPPHSTSLIYQTSLRIRL